MTPDDRVERAARGLLLGLVLGDAVGAVGGAVPAGATALRTTVAAQLACFTTEGLIRASVRFGSKGICHPPSVVWHALTRWAHGQAIAADVLYEQWRGGATSWPDGWLCEVPVLRERRGSAPATVAALRSGAQGTRQKPATGSAGFHGLVRALPVGLMGTQPPEMAELATDLAALTHGSSDGFGPAADGALIVAALAAGGDLTTALDDGLRRLAEVGSPRAGRYAAAVEAGRMAPGDAGLLRKHAPDRTASAALSGALYAASSFPGRDQILEAVTLAAVARGAGASATTGALLGALHGPTSLPVAELSRVELTWVADVLASDLVAELTETPGGHETLVETGPGHYSVSWADGTDPDWWSRYPGW